MGGFWGYGNLNGDYWFVGMEEGDCWFKFELNSFPPKLICHPVKFLTASFRSTSYLDEFGHYYNIPSIRPDLFVIPPYLHKAFS